MKYSFSNLQLLLTYTPANFNNKLGIYRLTFSINSKLSMLLLAHEEVLSQIQNWQKENNLIKVQGYSSGIESKKLCLRYETFINQIYNLFENFAKLIGLFYPKENLPIHFKDIKTRIIRKPFDNGLYFIFLNTSWYDEAKGLRDEAVHYLSGLITITNGEIPGYFNQPNSNRNGALSKIDIDDIVQHMDIIMREISQFCQKIGEHFLAKIDLSKNTVFFCQSTLGSNLILGRTISLEEYLTKQSGQCYTHLALCPYKLKCEAFRRRMVTALPEKGKGY